MPPRPRLDPAIFHLPVERMRAGYYSDKYFVRAREMLLADRHRPRVTMQVFGKAARLPRRRGRGDRHPQALRRRVAGAGGARALRRRRGRAVGDGDAHRRPLRRLRAPRDALPRRARAPHPGRHQHPARRGGRRAQGSDVLPRAARPLAGADRRRLRGAHRRRHRRLDRRAGVVVGQRGHRHGAPRAHRGLRRGHRARHAGSSREYMRRPVSGS